MPQQRFPYSIVWVPIPLVQWIFPFIGHMGICKSDGISYDFLGDYFINVGKLGFGPPHRFIPLSPGKAGSLPQGTDPARSWDLALDSARDEYESNQLYDFFGNNCHAFVMHVLDRVEYEGRGRWGMAEVALWMFFKGKYVGVGSFATCWLPWCIMVGLGLFFGRWKFAAAYGGLLALVGAYFLLSVSPKVTRAVCDRAAAVRGTVKESPAQVVEVPGREAA